VKKKNDEEKNQTGNYGLQIKRRWLPVIKKTMLERKDKRKVNRFENLEQ